MLRWAFDRVRTRGLFAATGGVPPTVVPHDVRRPHHHGDDIVITWIGHSSFLVQARGVNILTDPVFSDRCAPVQWAGPRRHAPPGVALHELPPIDIVVQSHDHYDHFDDASVRAIARAHPNARWYTPIGVARRLTARGVRHFHEMDWWETHRADGHEVTCVPAQHFSGRTPFDRNATLWAGFVLRVHGRALYFVGDTGWHDAFTDIGERCGPFDAVFMPIGAYDPRWIMAPVHVNPEEAVRAHQALCAAHDTTAAMIAMHWGTFVLTDEPIDEPPRRTREAWHAAHLPPPQLWVMSPGETRVLR